MDAAELAQEIGVTLGSIGSTQADLNRLGAHINRLNVKKNALFDLYWLKTGGYHRDDKTFTVRHPS